ncbi:MAG: hypothetical protein PF487_00095 [Bacteroidales bacterium]|jgi:hypothetical protein|nr:hypothetical protein [Bacteroidales bacterium]
MEKAKFTERELEAIYAIADEFGEEKKPALVREIKSLIKYDRVIMKNRILGALEKP